MRERLKKWKRISSKILLETGTISISEDTVRLPNGKTTSYIRQLPNQPHSVAVIALNKKNELLLQREYSYPPDEIMWQLPGGAIEAGETVKQAALRELSEESGYSAKKAVIIGSFYTNNRRSDQKQYIVLCRGLFERKLAEDPDEFIESHWLPLNDVRAMIKKGEIQNINLLAGLSLWQHSAYFKELS